MSHTYHMLCVECGEVADLGKLVSMDERGAEISPRFAGWRDQKDGQWLSGERLWMFIERWLILHRGHELVVVSESLLDQLDPEGRLSYIDSLGDLQERSPDGLEDGKDAAWMTKPAFTALERKLYGTE